MRDRLQLRVIERQRESEPNKKARETGRHVHLKKKNSSERNHQYLLLFDGEWDNMQKHKSVKKIKCITLSSGKSGNPI